MAAATPAEVLQQISRGCTVAAIALLTDWPPRQILLLASRYGYLPAAGGGLCKPPPHDKRSLPLQRRSHD